MRFGVATVCFAVLAAVMVLAIPTALASRSPVSANAATDQTLVVQQMAAMPLAFTENQGQWDERVLFRTSAGGATVWFCRDGIYHQFIHHPTSDGTDPGDLRGLRRNGRPRTEEDSSSVAAPHAKEDSVGMVVVKAVFVRANPAVAIAGEHLLAYRCNYFLGNDPSQWRTDVTNYTGLVYRDLYPGIDAHFEGQGGLLRTRYEARPGADLSQVQFRYDGNMAVRLTEAGELIIDTPWGAVMQSAPVPRDGGSKIALRRAGVSTYGMQAAGPADMTQGSGSRLVLVYSTFLGGTNSEAGYGGIAVNASGNAYVTGQTLSSNFPTHNPYDGSHNGGNNDAFVTKLSSAGDALEYSTFLGGGSEDVGYGIAVDGSGAAYVTGMTASSDFPTQNAYDATYNGGIADCFVAKLSQTGNVLEYSTFLGGSVSSEYGTDIVVDTSGSAYLTGETRSPDFPTYNPADPSHNGLEDAFVTKLDPAGMLGGVGTYSTFLGGSDPERGEGIAVDASGSAYVTGETLSSDFPTHNPYDGSHNGGYDGFVTKLDPAGMLVGGTGTYSTLLGGSSDDVPQFKAIAVDGSGSAYVTGYTNSPDFPMQNPYDGIYSGGLFGSAFVTKLAPMGNALEYSTFLGGAGVDAFAIAVDASGSAYVTGGAGSSNFPVLNPYDASFNGGGDAFVTKFVPAGNALEYSTFLGGSDAEAGYAIAVGAADNVYVIGTTSSFDFPTRSPYDGSYNQNIDAFVAKLALVPCACPCHADPHCDGQTDVLDVVGVVNVAFRAQPEQVETDCPNSREDVDCSRFVDVLDVVHMVDVAFRAGDPATEFCDPCL